MKPIRMLSVLLALATLSGCAFPSGDELLAAPKPSTNYQTLQVELEQLIASGVTYTAPVEGDNRSSIQLIDLNNDGTEEAIIFFRGASSATSNDLKIYIYRKQEDQYVCAGSVEGAGTAIQSVDYPVITPDGRRGMVVTWQLAADGTGALTMCDFSSSCMPGVLLETEYSAMELTDMTGDGAKDLLLMTTALDGKRVARLYEYRSGSLVLAGEAATSGETVSVERIRTGHVMDDYTAVFAEEKMASGVGLTTDIFVYADGTLINLALDGEDSVTRSTYRPVSVYAADVNGDGVTDLPRAVLMAGYTDAASSDAVFMLDWYAYSVDKPPVLVTTTYQNISDAWDLMIDPAWHDRITANKATDNGISAVTFSEYVGKGEQIPLFTIYCATGSNREYYAGRTDLLQLGQTAQAVYFARIADEAGRSSLQISTEEIQNRFSLVKQDWNN